MMLGFCRNRCQTAAINALISRPLTFLVYYPRIGLSATQSL